MASASSIAIASGVAAGILLLGATAAAAPMVDFTPESDVRPDEQRRIWALAKQAEAAGAPVGLAEFLIPVAFIESRFNPDAGPSSIGARGWYQIVTTSAFNWRNDMKHLQNRGDLLFDRKWATAAAADYVYRLVRYNSAPGQKVDWAAVRRGWKLPSLVKQTTGEAARRNRNQYVKAAEKTGIPTSILDKRVKIDAYPGIQTILDALGAKAP